MEARESERHYNSVNTRYIDFELNQTLELIKIGISRTLSDDEMTALFIAVSRTIRELQSNIKKQTAN